MIDHKPAQSGTIIPNDSLRMGDPGTSGGSQTLVVRGMSVTEFFSGQQMRKLAEQMLTFQRNGGIVVLS